MDHIIRSILRLYNGVFTEFRSIDEHAIAAHSGYTVERVKELLKRMWQLRIIRYIPANTSPMLFMDEERLPAKDIYISPDTYLHRKRLMHERFGSMLHYAEQQTECRSVVLQRYFGDNEATPCGVCDVCLAQRRRQRNDEQSLRESILALLGKEELSVRDLCHKIRRDGEQIAAEVDKMLSEGKISATISGKLIIIE